MEGDDPTHPVKDSVTIVVDKPTGIDPTLDDKVTAYPIPAGDYLNIRRVSSAPKTIDRKIIDTNGRIMYQNKIEISVRETIEQIDLSRLSTGTYVLYEKSGSNILTVIIVKE